MAEHQAHRIEIRSRIADTRARTRLEQLAGFSVQNVEIVDVYTLEGALDTDRLEIAANMLADPVTQEAALTPQAPPAFTWAIEVGYHPGVTDNVAHTTREMLQDRFHERVEAYTSQITFLSGDLTREEATRVAGTLANPLIQRIRVKSHEEFERDSGMGTYVPRVRLGAPTPAKLVNILEMSDEQLTVLGKKGIANDDGTFRGPLALDLHYLKTIQQYFNNEGRNPTDLELESIAQTWSEHCKHTIFADPLDEITQGLYRTFIKGATNRIREQKGDNDFCVSVFTDNAGAIDFDDDHLITDKVETHNSPSALDPFGGSITGIVGVNRDAIGFGLGAKPVANRYGFCLADPNDTTTLYRAPNKEQPLLPARTIMNGVIAGVNAGGNQSGIPTPQGFMYFDKRFRGKPLVFVGTLGLIPRESAGRASEQKQAQPGDYIVMVGGRVGADGIHGATFSSEALDAGSPATAVQIGDPITQKKLSDAIVKEARDRALYTSITDNGAGGISCSVAEMAKECGGFYVNLDLVPLKYPGLAPWETWISESQERMTLSVPKEKWAELSDLFGRRGVEATVIGEFNDSGRCVVDAQGAHVMNMDMEFLHEGLPQRQLVTTYTPVEHPTPQLPVLDMLTESLHKMLARPNIASRAFLSEQYDHEVQAGSVLKPLQGKGRVNADATVTKPLLGSDRAVVLSHGLTPSYGDIDPYQMAANAIDTAVRNAVAAGADLERIALLDNFCWCSSTEPERLGQLKRAVQACYNIALAYETPFISGKDSMFNDFRGYDENGEPVKISIPPTLLASSIAVLDNAEQAISIDAKMDGDLIYVLGDTHEELGGSEYYALMGEQERGEAYIGNSVPMVRPGQNRETYQAFTRAAREGLIASAQGVNQGGLAVALAKTAMAGKLGMRVYLDDLAGSARHDDTKLYSESPGRLLVTIAPQNRARFEELMGATSASLIGIVEDSDEFSVASQGWETIYTTVDDMLTAYRSRFEGY